MLKRRIFFRVLALLAALIVAGTMLASALLLKHHRSDTQELFAAQLGVLADRSEELVLWDDRLALQDLLRSMVRDHDVVEYAFAERQGRPYVHTFEMGVPTGLLGLPPGSRDAPAVRELETSDGRGLYDLAMPVGEEQVVMHLGLSRDAIGWLAMRDIWGLVAIAGVGIVAGVFLAGVTARLITREVEQANSALRENEERIRLTLDTALDAVINMNAEGVIIAWNPQAEAIFGWPEQEVLGRRLADTIVPLQLRDAHEQGFKRFLATGESTVLNKRIESRAIRRGGDEFPIELAIVPVRSGNEISFSAFLRDISDQKTLEDERQRAKEAAEAASRAKSEFLANMSHEIRTPLTAILGFAENIAENVAKPKNIEAIATVRRNSEGLLGIIDDILDLSKIEAGKMTVECIACSPCQIVAGAASLIRIRADAKELPFEIEYDSPIPETIQTDPTRLRQILINVMGNAIKFTERGSVRLVTSFVDDHSTPRVQFDVVDTGLGLSDEQVAALFQPFTQADASTTRRFGGTGLGLAISQRLAELLGGEITVVETQQGVGSRFRVTVPTGPLEGVRMIRDPMAATVMTNVASGRGTSTDQQELRGCRILLAEDGLDNQRLIALILKKAGAEVTVVENGKLAVDAALAARDEGSSFDVILMDMQMPVMDGYEATGNLRQTGYSGPIIALTAHAMASDRGKCIKAGCDDYATKPIKRKKLIEMIQAHLKPMAVA